MHIGSIVKTIIETITLEPGQDLAEYGLVITPIAVVAIAILTLIDLDTAAKICDAFGLFC